MKKFEHKTIRVGTNLNFMDVSQPPDFVDHQLNKLGIEGWKTQTSFSVPVVDAQIRLMFFVILVREIPETPDK